MRSKVSIMGHPLHPLLVALPIGLFAWTLVADIIYAGSGRTHEWYSLSFWSGIAAIVTALLAALPGFGDYFTIALHSDARGMATAHMLLNLTLVALFFVAMLLMLDDGALRGGRQAVVLVLHAIGVGFLLLSGWLGGEMVFRHHLAMIPDDAALAQAEQTHHELHPRSSPR
jgi:uncharacterized membrane protein